MHILIIGGSGRVGQLAIEEALERGHTVTALVRDESKLKKKDGLTIVKGNPLAPSDLQSAFKTPTPPTTILTTLAARRTTDSPFSPPHPTDSPPRLMADIITAIRAQLHTQPPLEAGTKPKLIILSMAGCADSFAGLPWITRLLFTYSPMRHQLVDHGLVDEETRAGVKDAAPPTPPVTPPTAEALEAEETTKAVGTTSAAYDFTILRPVMFDKSPDAPAKPIKIWPESGSGLGVMTKITRRSVASFMLDVAEGKGEGSGMGGCAPVISN